MDATLALTLTAAAGVSLGLAMLLGHPLTTKILAVLGTTLAGAVLVVLLLT